MIGRVMLRVFKGFSGTSLAVMIAALTFLKGNFSPEGEIASLLWKSVIVGLIGGGILGLEKLKKMLNQHD